jgi:DNA primase
MSTSGDDQDRPGGGASLAEWRRPLPQPDPRAADLSARTVVVRGSAAATLDRAGTTDAIHRPPITSRDPALVKVVAAAGRFYQSCLAESWVPGYLASRGLDAALLPTSPWKIGYAPASWTALMYHLRGLGFHDRDMLQAGLIVRGRTGRLRDYFYNRLLVPLRAEDGIAIGFIGRRYPDASDDHGPKYLNTPDTAIFTKGRVLAGLAEGRNAFRRGAQPVLTEGAMDAIAVSIAAPGLYAGVAPCGTALTAEQVAALARSVPLADRGVLVALDGDTAGRIAAVRAYSRLTPVTSRLTSTTLPKDSDPAAILEASGRASLRDALTCGVRQLADLVVDNRMADWAHGRDLVFTELQVGALRAAATAMAAMPAEHVGPQAARLCALFAERYGWKPTEVTTELVDTIDRYFHSDTPDLPMPPWAVVRRATAPPRQRTATVTDGMRADRQLRLVRQAQEERS